MGFDYTNQLLSVDIQLIEPPITILKGTTSFPFLYQLPKDLIPTFMGQGGSIIHSAEVVVYVKRGLTRKWEREYKVLAHNPEHSHFTINIAELEKSNECLHIRLGNNIIQSHVGFQIQFKIDSIEQTGKVQFDIIRCEKTKSKFKSDLKSIDVTYTDETSMVEKYFVIKPDDRGEWIEICFAENLQADIFSFKSKNIEVEYYLKVTLEMELGDDVFVTFPLSFLDGPLEMDVLDEIEMNLEKEPEHDDREG